MAIGTLLLAEMHAGADAREGKRLALGKVLVAEKAKHSTLLKHFFHIAGTFGHSITPKTTILILLMTNELRIVICGSGLHGVQD